MSAPSPELQAAPAAGADEPEVLQRRLGFGAWLATAWLAVVVLAALLAPLLPLADPQKSVPELTRQTPTAAHPFGGDGIGRDLLSRTAWGGRASLVVATGAVTAGMLLGGSLGLVAGYYRGAIGATLAGLFDVLLAFPQAVFALALVVFLQGDPSRSGGLHLAPQLVLIISLTIVLTPIFGRITRASALAWSQREFVTAAWALGARHTRVLTREVLPNVAPALLYMALLSTAIVIVVEGTISLLGVGIQPPTPSWGNIIAIGRSDLRDAPHIVFMPSGVLFLTTLALNHLGDAIRARFDVRESAL